MDIVTGANGGIGKEITLGLARRGHRVIMACRNTDAAENVRQEIIAASGNRCIEVWPLDLTSFEHVRTFAERMRQDGEKVQLLVNNAGIMCRDFSVTEDGFETMTQVNYMGPYLLTRLLLPVMQRGAMIVNTSSCTYRLGKVENDFFQADARNYALFRIYGNAKLAVLLFTVELAERCREMEIGVNAVDPGVVNTNMITMHRWFDPLADLFFRPFIRSPRQGADTTLFLADEAYKRHFTASFWKNRRRKTMPQMAQDDMARLQLWERTEQLLTKYL